MPEYNEAHLVSLLTSLGQAWQSGQKLVQEHLLTPSSPNPSPPKGVVEEDLASHLYDIWRMAEQIEDELPRWSSLKPEERLTWVWVARAAIKWVEGH